MHLIDASTAGLPQLTNTWFLALIKGLYHKVAGRNHWRISLRAPW